MPSNSSLWFKSIDLVTLALVVIGALNWGLIGAFNFNLVNWVATNTFTSLEPAVYILVGVAALFHIFSRDYYLPFLGDTAYPCGSLSVKTPKNANVSIEVKVEPNVNVIYWAAEVNEKIYDNPWVAYDEFENAGVARSDEFGRAILRVRSPASYKVGHLVKRTLKPHVHYRVCKHTGMLGRVETAYVN